MGPLERQIDLAAPPPWCWRSIALECPLLVPSRVGDRRIARIAPVDRCGVHPVDLRARRMAAYGPGLHLDYFFFVLLRLPLVVVVGHAENQSRNSVHEVIIAREDGAQELPMDAKRVRVIESRVRRLGEIADLAPGKSGKLTLDLKPGSYVLFCNQPGHYQDGMFATLTVAP